MAVGKDKRRLIITVPAHVAETIHQLAEESGVSAASLCGQMLTEAMPAFQQLRRAMQLARAKQASAYELMSEVMAEVISDASQVQMDAIEQKRKFTRRPRKPGQRDADGKA